MLTKQTSQMVKIIAISCFGICTCIVLVPIIFLIADVSSSEYESDRLPNVVKASNDGKYLAKIYTSNYQPPFWTFRPTRFAGVYIQRKDPRQEWLVAQPKDRIGVSGDVAWQADNSLLLFSGLKMTLNKIDVDGKIIQIRLMPAL